MKKIVSSLFIISTFISQSSIVSAHAEHDKPRYVAENGVDNGRCDIAAKPCKTIRYTAQHANKGDNIRIAEGSYPIDDTDTLFYLLSQTLVISGNYSQTDGFHHKNEKYVTKLIGVPLEYAQALTDKGFSVIVDSKQQSSEDRAKINAKLKIYAGLQQAQSEVNCSGGFAGDHPCNNLDLLAHVPLSGFSTNPAEANDIWGHFDLNDRKEYALIGLRNGVGIVEVTDPTTPRVVTTIPSQSTIWRDLKVYQFFDHQDNRWKSYAYVTADNASVGMLVIDLTGLPQTATVVNTLKTDLSAHNVYLSNVDYSTGVPLTGYSPYLHIAGSNRNGGAFNSYDLVSPTIPQSVFKPTDATRSNYSHDVSSMVITDTRKDTQCVNGTDHCEIFFDFNENDFQLWDKTVNSTPERLSTTTYTNASYVHSGWYTEDKLVVIVHDELDEQNVGLNTTVRFFEISDLTNPTQIATWTGPTRSIDHNGFVRGNRYYMSNYERGMTVLDITDPSSPFEVGFFDTYPLNDSASFNGAWGVYPYLPSGNILVSDINSGLYILRDKTLTSNKGSFSFNQTNYDVNEGDEISISVNRSNGSQGVTQVGWELATGAADINDYTQNQGVLEWLDGESDVKTITVATLTDNQTEPAETFFIRLFDPKNGATLAQPNLATITIAASTGNNPPVISAGDDITSGVGNEVSLIATASDPDGDNLSIVWTQIEGESVVLNDADSLTSRFTPSLVGNYVFEVTATDPQNNSVSDSVSVTIDIPNNSPTVNAGNDQTITIGNEVNLTATASDPDGGSFTVLWTQVSGDTVTLNNTNQLATGFTPNNTGTYEFNVTVTDPQGNSDTDSIVITVLSVVVTNHPPVVDAGNDQSVTVGDTVNLLATASDEDGDTLTYSWQQTSGQSVTLSSNNTLQTSFTASQAGDFSFEITVTDEAQLSVTSSVNVKVKAEQSQSSGGGSFGFGLLLGLGFVRALAKKK